MIASVALKHRKNWLGVLVRLSQDETIQARMEEAGLDVLEYSTKEGRYKLRLSKSDLEKHHEFLSELFKLAQGDTEA